MTTLKDTTPDEIYNKIMIILVANEGILYNQYNLYSLVLCKFNDYANSTYKYVPPEFKYNFFLTLRELMLKNDNVKVIKKNSVYYVIYNEPQNLTMETIDYDPYWINYSQLNKFIIDNNLDLNYQDPESGNSIYHDMLSDSDYYNVKKIIETNKINYEITNNHGKTPIECIKDIQVASIIIDNLNKKLNHFERRLIAQENQYNPSIFNSIKKSFCNFVDNYGELIFFATSSLIFLQLWILLV